MYTNERKNLLLNLLSKHEASQVFSKEEGCMGKFPFTKNFQRIVEQRRGRSSKKGNRAKGQQNLTLEKTASSEQCLE
uniref:Uncharacterized protein n=1 Tax=Romanomermis culicivorax TaxID=13658 RepID=A0A915KXY7_ROMCU